MGASTFLALTLLALPPPLCRGRSAQAYDPRLDGPPAPRALAEVQTAYDALCPERNCGDGSLHSNPTAGNNAYTWVSGISGGQGTRAKIVYSKQFLDGLSQQFGAGASFGVLAHEIGHHLTAARALRKNLEPAWNEELRADYFAGCALGRSGQSLDALEGALRALASTASPTHPSFKERIPVVRKGFAECRKTLAKVAMMRPAFGLSTVFGLGRRSNGCWHYPYRLDEERGRLGPNGPRIRLSSGHKSKTACEVARRKRGDRESLACQCSEGP